MSKISRIIRLTEMDPIYCDSDRPILRYKILPEFDA
jgi:hypothetical protein